MGIEQTTRSRRRPAATMQTEAARGIAPRIYALHAGYLGATAGWSAHLGRIAELGCDAVLTPAGFDVETLMPVAAEAGLAVYVDIEPNHDRVAGALRAAAPGSFDPPADDQLDPRRPPAEFGFARARWDDAVAADRLLAAWSARLQAFARIGVAGFRCLGLGIVPPAAWAALATAVPDCRLLAWTPGLSRRALSGLRGLGFTGVFDSLAWWDGRAGWYAEECAALAAHGPVIATLEAPGGPRFAAGFERTGVAAAARRQIAMAGMADGLLVSMGFEYGARWRFHAGDTPDDWDRLSAMPDVDLRGEIAAANAMIAGRKGTAGLVALTGAGAPFMGWFRRDSGDLLLANNDAAVDVPAATLLAATGGNWRDFRPIGRGPEEVLRAGITPPLEPGEMLLYRGSLAPPVLVPPPPVVDAAAAPRVAIEAVAPAVDGGRFAVKRVAGELLEVTADLLCDGHDRLAGILRWRAADDADWQEVPLRPLGNDRWAAAFALERVGRYVFQVEAWVDVFATFRHGLDVKAEAGIDVSLEIEEGRLLVAAAAGFGAGHAALAQRLDAAKQLERLALLRSVETAALMQAADPRSHCATSAEMPVEADRAAARFASWYELFPRSQSGDPLRHGTFADVIRQLPRVRAMGFDVLYFPPIHPIGRAFRKGPNNTLTPAPDDPGSPYAIGSEDGGHDAIHPQLGTLEEFRALRDAAAAEGLELALDFAVQCSPDHPWLREHREWFAWRPDGSLRYAENPPKKYQDIVNVDFHGDGAVPDLWLALRDVVRFWLDEGVRLFRVDNPHTKPFPFWEWLIADIRAIDPGAVFLAEAFTRPKVMYRLAKLGFGQSYTYFTWRNEKAEIMAYLAELSTTATRDFFRPHFFANTPDINPVFLQRGGRPAHLIRAALAATLSGLWGMYQGFEFCEARPLPGREEYLDSEKYQLRVWPDRAPGDIVDEITQLNLIRRTNPALHDHLGIAFHEADNDQVLWFRKRSADGTNVLLVAVSLDPFAAQEANVELPLWEWTLPDDATLEAEELMRGNQLKWRGKTQRIRLDTDLPFGIWRVHPLGAFRPHLPPVAATPAPTGHG